MNTPYTPGPWAVRGRAGYTGHGVNDSTGRSVCSVPSNGNRPHDERNANVALLAAAPDLLAALQRLNKAYEESTEMPCFGVTNAELAQAWGAARAAIQKTTGAS